MRAPGGLSRSPLAAAAACFALAAVGCGGGELAELPVDAGGVARNGVITAVTTGPRDAWLLHRNPRVGGAAPGDLAHWDGDSLTLVDLPDEAQTASVAVVGPDHVIVSGAQVLEVRGTQVTDITDQVTGAATFRVASRGDGVVYAHGFGVVLKRAAGAAAWEQLPAPPGGFAEIAVTAPDRLMALGDGNGTTADGVYTFDGAAWREQNPRRTARQLSAAAENDVWALRVTTAAVATLEVQHWDGTAWTNVAVTVRDATRGMTTPMLVLHGVVALGGGRAGAVVLRTYNTTPPRREVLWVTGDRRGMATERVIRVYCNTLGCTDGGDFTGRPAITADGTLFVGPYYGSVPR